MQTLSSTVAWKISNTETKSMEYHQLHMYQYENLSTFYFVDELYEKTAWSQIRTNISRHPEIYVYLG